MTFEFVIIYQRKAGESVPEILLDRLRGVLTDNLNEFDDDATTRMLTLNFERRIYPVRDEAGATSQRTVLGFTLDLPDESASARPVLDEFAEALVAAPIEHAVKFEDPLLRHELAQRAEELFALEMKLRRVLSVIYLHAYHEQPFNLLREETVKPMNPATEEHMKNVAENEFFFLTFGQYIDLNKKPDMKQIPMLLELIRTKETYDALRAELERLPVTDEDDAVFLAGLRQRMDAIEAMRNCVAHNRRPSKKVTENYLNARPQVDASLDAFLARWAIIWHDDMDDGEMIWDTAAREAVDDALENADWDEEAKTITLYAPHDPRVNKTVASREELEDYLRNAASDAFYANCSRDDGEFISECDEYGILESALADYEERLETFFAEAEENEAET